MLYLSELVFVKKREKIKEEIKKIKDKINNLKEYLNSLKEVA